MILIRLIFIALPLGSNRIKLKVNDQNGESWDEVIVYVVKPGDAVLEKLLTNSGRSTAVAKAEQDGNVGYDELTVYDNNGDGFETVTLDASESSVGQDMSYSWYFGEELYI